MFLDKTWNPTGITNINEKNAFIHAINLAICGPLFADVQTFLRVYAMSKRMALIKT